MKSPSQPDALIRWMGSLGDPARLRIVRLLERHELGVAELSDILQLPQSTISRHLKLLSDEGWLHTRRVGTTHLSTLRHDGLDAVQARLWQLTREQVADWASVRQDELRLERRLRQRTDDSRRFFTGAAGAWDSLRAEYYGADFSWHAMLALLPSEAVVADLGCGTGQILQTLAPYVSRGIGVDNTPAMLEAAANRLKGVKSIELRQGELEALPIDDASVDGALMVLALSYVAEPSQCLAEMKRILKPGGKAVIVDVTAHDREDVRIQMGQSRLGFDRDTILTLFTESGLTFPSYHALPPAADVKGPALFFATARRTT
jgi:SAM-dependent methyltransferase